MPARDQPTVRGRRAIRRALSDVATDLRTTRLALGLSQQQVADAIGVSRSYVGRLERDEIGSPRLEHLATFASCLGMRLRLALYPDGEPIRDRVQLRLLDAFHARMHPSLGWRSEVPLPLPNDRRAWDAVATADDGWTAIEGITRLGAVDATLRATNRKPRDDPRIRRVVLVIADTVRNREAIRLAVATIRAEYPLGTRDVLAALSNGRPPPLNGIVLVKVAGTSNRGPPVHTSSTAGENWWTRAARAEGDWWKTPLEAPGQGRRVGPARRGRWRPGAEAIASNPLRPAGRDHLKATPTSRPRSHQRQTLSGRFGRFIRQWWRLARVVILDARTDVTGIPVSVLHPGVEA